MLCQFPLYRKGTVIRLYTFFIFHYDLFQEIGYSSLCCTVGPYCLSILNVIVGIYEPQTLGKNLVLDAIAEQLKTHLLQAG